MNTNIALQKELHKLKSEIANKYNKSQASFEVEIEVKDEKEKEGGCECCEKCAELEWQLKSLNDYLNYRADYARQDIETLFSIISKHFDGHLPNPQGASQMQKAIDALGLSGDFEVIKKPIFASMRKDTII